jgi:hypothetical protein
MNHSQEGGTRHETDSSICCSNRFVRGEMAVTSNGVGALLQRPLNFLVVADHAENLGLAPMIVEKNPDLLKTNFGKIIYPGI